MTASADNLEADRLLKARHRAMWALGDYPTLAAEIIPDLGAVLVDACSVRPGHRVLDVAAGSGNAAIQAALAGASVVACDLTPELLGSGRERASWRGVEVEWREADAEALPFSDGEFDTVLSCVGVMFAPHHQASADEMVRVCRAGGTIGLLSWTPEGFVGQMFAAMKPYVASPPPGAQPPPLWGSEDHVTALLGDRVTSVDARRQTVTVDRFAAPDTFRDYFKAHYGPTIAAYRGMPKTPPASPHSTATSPNSHSATTAAMRRPSWNGSTYYSPPGSRAEVEHGVTRHGRSPRDEADTPSTEHLGARADNHPSLALVQQRQTPSRRTR